MSLSHQTLFKDECNYLRRAAKEIGVEVREMIDHDCLRFKHGPEVDVDEAKANLMLAFRHLEDARMRLGKAIQATEGGVSIYDR